MKSRTCCFNGAVLRRALSRSALLWGGYLVLWLVGLPANLLSKPEWTTALSFKDEILSTAAYACHLVSFFYGLLVAWFLFLYLYRSRSANFFGALPLRRETLFLTQYLAGLLCALVPNFLIMGATMLAGSARGVNLITESGIWFAANSLAFVFYYSLAVFCAMAVGNLVAMPALYVIVNFVVVVVEATVKELLEGILYGFRFTGGTKLGFLSPFYDAVLDGNGPECNTVYTDGKLTDVIFKGWKGLLILAAVGIVLAVAAFFLYRCRRMEVAGDVIAFKPLKPVFRYAFTFGCAVVGGTVLSEILVSTMASQYAVYICACVVGCTAVGYFLSEMILLRTLRVFRKRNLMRCAVCVFVAVAALACIRLDILGVESYVPDEDEVASVRLEYARHPVSDRVIIEQVTALHREILERKTETEALCREDVWTPRIEIAYTLTDGREVERSYRLPVVQNQQADPDSLIYKFEEIDNTPEMILARQLPDEEVSIQNMASCSIYYYDEERGYSINLDPTNAEVCQLWYEAMLLDFKAGNMGTTYYTDRDASGSMEVTIAVAETAVPAPTETYSDVSVEFELYQDGSRERTSFYYYDIPDTAVHTRAALVEMGVPAEAFAIPEGK